MPPEPGASLPLIGWREWLALPELGVRAIQAKVDTGARSSALHAFQIEVFQHAGLSVVRFHVHPWQRSDDGVIVVEAPLAGERLVRNSGGLQTLRPVIVTELELAGQRWPIEITLTARDAMGFRMLLGRQAIRRRFMVDAGRSYLLGKRPTWAPRRVRRRESQ